MKRIGAVLLAALLALLPETAVARGHDSHSRSSISHHSTSSKSTRTHRDYGTSAHKRDPAHRRAFQHQHPCPSTGRKTGSCPGYVVDHIKPLKRGGVDRPSNMQWQTVAEAKAKDRVE